MTHRLRDRVVPFRILWIVIFIWSLLRLLAVMIMPWEASIFAPDEGTYAGLTSAVAAGEDWRVWGSGWGAGFWPQGRALLLPASMLTSLHLDPILALRLVSFVYATGSAALLMCLLWISIRRGRYGGTQAGPKLISWQTLGLGVFLLLPSHLLWNSLALREAPTEFWALSAVTLCAVLFTFALRWWHRVLIGIGIALSLSLVFQSRGYMAAALSFALLAGVVWIGRERPRVSVTLAGAALAGTALGLALSAPAQVPQSSGSTASSNAAASALRASAEAKLLEAQEWRVAAADAREQAEAADVVRSALERTGGDVNLALVLLAKEPSGPLSQIAQDLLRRVSSATDPSLAVGDLRKDATTRALAAAAAAAREVGESQKLFAAADAAQAEAAGSPEEPDPASSLALGVDRAQAMLNPDAYLQRGSYQREVSAQYANSAIATDSCTSASSMVALRLCEITRIPGASFAVMFRPLWPLDTPTAWSQLAVAANAENMIWLVLVLLVFYATVTRKPTLPRVLWISALYGLLIVAGMATLEGNFGTAFRHKSNILWVLCVALLLAGPARWPRRSTSGDDSSKSAAMYPVH